MFDEEMDKSMVSSSDSWRVVVAFYLYCRIFVLFVPSFTT